MADTGKTRMPGETSKVAPRGYSAYIAGEWQDLEDRERIFSKDPSTEQDWYHIPSCSASDVDEAVQRLIAHSSMAPGPDPSTRTRQSRAGNRRCGYRQCRDVARIEFDRCGKVLSETTAFMNVCADYLRFFGELADKITGYTFTPPPAGIMLIPFAYRWAWWLPSCRGTTLFGFFR